MINFNEHQDQYKKIKEKVTEHIQDEVSQGIGRIEDAATETYEVIKEEVVQAVEENVSNQIEMAVAQQVKGLRQELIKGFYEFQNKLRYHKIVYGFLVMSGFMLFWYGSWRLLAQVRFFESGVIPTILGFILLFITGTLYYKLVGDK